MATRKTKETKFSDTEYQYADAIPFYIWRSDGTEMPAEYNHYQKVEEGAKPILEWQNKLGQALAAELMPEASGQFFLAEFPEHYHLRWYQTKEENKKNQAKHYYLFGYPEDPGASKARKYFRSPNQFLPHLLWLIGESNDRGDCACEFCSGSKPITSKSAKTIPKTPSTIAAHVPSLTPPSAASSTSSSSTIAPTPSVSAGTPIPQNTNPPPASGPSSTSNGKAKPVGRPPVASQQPAQGEVQAVAPAQTSTTTVNIVNEYDALFRPGEAVWFRNNNSWRVGMVLTFTRNPSVLSIIPFAHPLYQTQEVVKEESDVRPFLAFSIPQISPALEELKGVALAEINWEALQERFDTKSDPSRQEALAVEATKLAAVRVDQCYSTFNPYGTVEKHDVYGGIFLGAEKICVGEAVRIRLSPEQQDQPMEKGMPVVMVVRRVLIDRETEALVFEGSLWRLKHVALTQPATNLGQEHLPAAMHGEKEFRDGLLRDSGWRVDWLLMNQSIMADEATIRGRFYETQRLTPLLNPVKFQEMLHNRQIEDIQNLLNNRGDSKGPRVGAVVNRALAVAGAVPDGILASLGPDVVEN
ncbi:hypothetical protein GGS20DRAFT_580151 [Poronia punctata]|nr:hypothetical protein GGS20DRAFT_580151 [Poronia punctata]